MGKNSWQESLDYILAREAQLMYQRAPGFHPEKGNLKKWVGELPGRDQYSHIKFKIELIIPENFPNEPPNLRIATPCKHPNVMDDGTVSLRILDQWKGNYHLYQVINGIKGLFARAPPMPAATITPSAKPAAPVAAEPETVIEKIFVEEESEALKQRVGLMKQELERMQQSLAKRDEDLAMARAKMFVHNIPEKGEISEKSLVMPDSKPEKDLLELESEKIAIEDLLASLEEKFADGELSATDYTKLYRQYKKQLYLVNKAFDEKQSERGAS
jgi:ubiquitin-conjugating enzyme E2 N